MHLLQDILTALGGLVLGGGGLVAIAYTIFKIFSEKWLNAKFEEQLAAYKHAQQKELEQLKLEIAILMDRTVKLHQREFDVLPEAWGRLTDAFNITRAVSFGFHRSPNLDMMSAEQLEEFLERSRLDGWQKNELRAAHDKSTYYANAITRHDLNKAAESVTEFHAYLDKNGIFIPEPIKAKFVKLDDLLYGALMERQSHPHKPEKVETLHTKGPALLKIIEKDVQGRLWSSQPTEDE
jgi:hypothetical protein